MHVHQCYGHRYYTGNRHPHSSPLAYPARSQIEAVNGRPGDYDVKRGVNSDVYHEVISTQNNNVGKNTESIEYRDVLVAKGIYNVEDKLRSVEQIIGTNGRDMFKGGEHTDYFYGGEGQDVIYGNGGNDLLYCGDGLDVI